MSRKPGIPVFGMDQKSIYAALQAMKTNIEMLTGARGRPISRLSKDATSDDVIAKINEIIARLNARGE